MSRTTKKAAVPKLRFPEFERNGEWEKKKLGDIADHLISKNKKFSEKRVLTNSASDGVVDQRDYFDKDIASQGNLDGYYIVNEGDFVYNPRISNLAPVGPISRNNIGTGVMSPLYTVFRFKSGSTDFFEQYFKSNHWHPYLRSVANTGARHDRMAITTDILMGMPIYLPSLKEQQKIADCLSDIDDLISAQSDQIAALQKYRRGMLQQIFPQDGETTPRLRFPEFQNDGEWEERSLGMMCESISSGRDKADPTGKFDLFGSTGVIGKTANATFRGKFILVARVGANAGHLTMASGGFGVTDNTIAIVLTDQRNTDFIFYFLSSLGLNKLVFGSGQPLITGGQLKDLRIRIAGFSEQQRIVECLASLEELIAVQTARLESLKLHKNGLLQQLFPPSMEER